jgi:hypothetical protein
MEADLFNLFLTIKKVLPQSKQFRKTRKKDDIRFYDTYYLESSVVDPDPDVFGPPGFRSIIICTDPDPSIIKHK